MTSLQIPPMVVLLPNTLAHLSFELVFQALIAFSLSSSMHYHKWFVSPVMVVLLPNTLVHLSFKFVFLGVYCVFSPLSS